MVCKHCTPHKGTRKGSGHWQVLKLSRMADSETAGNQGNFVPFVTGNSGKFMSA